MNRTVGIFFICGSLLSLFAPSSSEAQVTVNNIMLTFQITQRPVQNVMVGNSSDQPAYVLASLERVLDPELGGNKAEPSEDLLISPKAFSVEPQGQRAVRFLLRKPAAEKEVVYRALFTPQDRGFGQEIKRDVGGRTASIRVLTGMGVLLFVEPRNARGKLEWKRTSDSISFINTGNVHVELAEGKSCHGDDCTSLERKRVYADATYDVKVPEDAVVTFLARSGSAGVFETVTIEPLGDGEGQGVITPAVNESQKK